MAMTLQQRALLEMIEAGLATSQIELAHKLGLSPSSVNRTIRRMENEGLISRDHVKRGARGRPILNYKTRKSGAVLIIQWINIEWIAAVFEGRELKGEILRFEYQPVTNWEEALERLKHVRDKALSQAHLQLSDLQRIVLAINAVKTSSKQSIVSSVMPWLNERNESDFSQSLGCKTELDLRPPWVLPELRIRMSEGVRSLMVLSIEDGVGAHGASVDENWGVLGEYRGELGHVVLDPRGPLCGCGHRGCIEALISGPAICQKIESDVKDGFPTILKNSLHKTPPEIFDELERLTVSGEDPYANTLIEEYLERAAWCVSILANVVGPDVIVLAGYGLNGRELWCERIRQKARSMTLHGEKLSIRLEPPRLSDLDYFYELAVKRPLSRNTFTPPSLEKKN